MLSGNLAMPPFEPDTKALRASSVRIVPAIGAVGAGGLARRGGEAVARLLGVEPVVFPGDHGGFAAKSGRPTTTRPRSPRSSARCSSRTDQGHRGSLDSLLTASASGVLH